MALRLVTHAERPELRHLAPAAEDVWPEYNLHGDVMNEWWGALLERVADRSARSVAARRPHFGGVGQRCRRFVRELR